MQDPRHELGKFAEELAALWWSDRGATILARNFRLKMGELDLIVEKPLDERGERHLLIFVEVRARHQAWGEVDALATITARKRHRIRRAAEVYLSRYSGRARDLRFDLMTWDPEGGLRHLPGAWHY